MINYRSLTKQPSQSPVKSQASDLAEEETSKKNEFLKSFLIAQILPLWPENWMQLNVLLHMSNSKPAISGQQHHQSRNPQQNHQSSLSSNAKSNITSSSLVQSPAATTSNPVVQNTSFATNGSIINLASKSGK